MHPIKRSYRCLSRVLLSIMAIALTSSELRSDDTCNDPANEPSLDRQVLDTFGCSEGWLAWFRDHFNFQEDHWDEGWGWNQPTNLFREFGRMSTAGQVMQFGISERVQEWWPRTFSYPPRMYPIPATPSENPGASRVAATFSGDATLHIFYRSTNNDLLHATLYPYDSTIVNFTPYNITSSIPIWRLGYVPTITGTPMIVESTDSHMWVLTAGSSNPDKVLLFKELGSGAWMVTELISQAEHLPQFKICYPCVVQTQPGVFLVYGVNGNGQLVRYLYNRWETLMVDLPMLGQYNRLSASLGSLSAIQLDSGAVHVFGVSRDGGHVLHFWSDSDAGGMQCEDLTQNIVGSSIVAWFSPLRVCSDTADRISVYGRSRDSLLIRYHADMQYSGTVPTGFKWTCENVSANAQIEPASSTGFFPEPFPIRTYFSAIRDTATCADLVAVSGNKLVHFAWRPGQGWKQTKLDTPSLNDSPTAVLEPDGTQRVFVETESGQLFIATKSSDDRPWQLYDLAQHLELPPAQISYYTIDRGYGLTSIYSPNGKRHVIGWRPGRRCVLDAYDILSFSWYSGTDYVNWASGSTHGFRYEPEKSNDAFATAYCGGVVVTDRVEMKCLSFEEDVGPGRRAGTMVHEATHIMYGGFWGPWYHEGDDDDPKDPWIQHYLGEIPRGTLEGGTENHKHSMYQIQIMYWADLAEFPAWWVSIGTSAEARTNASVYMGTHIIDPPGWRVGEPRPLGY